MAKSTIIGRQSKKSYQQNYKFTDTALVNDATYFDYLERMKKIALSMFEWVNLPSNMNSRWLERTLYYNGQAALLKDDKLGFINTACSSAGYVDIYGLPTAINCYSFGYQKQLPVYKGINPYVNKKVKKEDNEAILVLNDWEGVPTCSTIELFALRLYEIQRTIDTNVKTQKFPIMVVVDEKQRLFMENLYSSYDGNQPFIFGDSMQLSDGILKSINTGAPFVADKLNEYKKDIWNEMLIFLGVNTISTEKKERMIRDEVSSNNELINLNLQSYLAPRLKACEQFNEKYNLKGTDKEISVRVRSDLENFIKHEYNSFMGLEESEGVKEDGKI